MSKSKLLMLVESMNGSEYSFSENHLFSLKLNRHLYLLQNIKANRFKSDRQLKQYYKTKKEIGTLARDKKELYLYIIEALDKFSLASKAYFPAMPSLIEYSNILHRVEMSDRKQKLLEESIIQNQKAGNEGLVFDLTFQLFKVSYRKDASISKNNKLIVAMRESIKQMEFLVNLAEISYVYYDIIMRNFIPEKGSEDYKLLETLRSSKIYKRVDPITHHNACYLWYNVQSLIYFSLGQQETCFSLIKRGIAHLSKDKSPDSIYWKGVLELYRNLIDFYAEVGDHQAHYHYCKVLEEKLEKNKHFIYSKVYTDTKISLFKSELWAYKSKKKWSKGLAFAKKEFSKKIYKDAFLATVPMYNSAGSMAFGLSYYDVALSYFNQAIELLRDYSPVKGYLILFRLMLILCNVEKNQYAFADSQIGALRKYISYHKVIDEYKVELLNLLKRYIRHKGSGKETQILEAFYQKYKNDPTQSERLDFLWIQSKVENKTIKEISGAF